MITQQNLEDLKRLYELLESMRRFGGPSASVTLVMNPAEAASLSELLRSMVMGEFNDDAPISPSWVFWWLHRFADKHSLPADFQKELFQIVRDINRKFVQDIAEMADAMKKLSDGGPKQ